MSVINPFCPISFGFLGLLGSIITRHSTLLKDATDPTSAEGEYENLLIVKGEEDDECDELSEARINRYLEHQKQQYYKSIGMEPLRAHEPQQSTMNDSTSTTNSPNTSILQIDPSSRDSSLIEEINEATNLPTSAVLNESVVEEYAMDNSDHLLEAQDANPDLID